jgi:predicted DNA binding CopG/RHH family protein
MLPVQATPFGEQKEKERKEKMIKEKKKKEKREVEVKIRLTVQEKETIKKLAEEEGLTLSKYIRTQALKKKGKIQTEIEKKIEYELNKIGTNINQMVRALNILLNLLMKKGELKDRDRKLLKAIEVRLEKASNELKGVKDVFRRSSS